MWFGWVAVYRAARRLLPTGGRGKVVRAEPVAALYQQGRAHHIGTFPQLEDQMTNFTSDIDRAAAGYSPDRVLGTRGSSWKSLPAPVEG
jgi:phage terminase large subunit-like protein